MRLRARGFSVNEVITRIGQQAELGRADLGPDGRQVGFAEGHPGDRESIDRIALAGPAAATSLPPPQVRRDLAHGEPRGDEVVGNWRTV
jgi:hypothetical protein